MKKIVLSLLLCLIPVIGFAADYTQDPNCQGAWLFEEGSGATVADSSLNSNMGTFRGNDEPVWLTETPGLFSSYSVDFDGSNDYVNVGSDTSLDNLNTFTWVFWMKPEGTPGWNQGGIFEKGHHSTSTKIARDHDIGSGDQDAIKCSVYCATTNAVSRSHNDEFPDGNWYHCAITYDQTTDRKIRIYKNGTEISYSSQIAGVGVVSDDSGYNFYIGGNPPNAFYAFNGKLDEVAIFSRVLSLSEINDIINNGLNGSGGGGAVAPTANISATPTNGQAPLDVYFTGTGSDPDGWITSYSWDFGDGEASLLQNPIHTYYSPANYTATLTVTDNDGLTDTASIVITVSDLPGPIGEIPQLIRFQARLEDNQGMSLDGTFNLTFRLYDTNIGGVPLWEEQHQDVDVEDGMLDVELGSRTQLDLPFDRLYWLGVEVSSDGEMSPRFKLTTVPYSFKSKK